MTNHSGWTMTGTPRTRPAGHACAPQGLALVVAHGSMLGADA